ncbi:MAG: hypothetical protein PF482_01285 [Desulfobacteraceae bacterium]|jgi:hypothetical protein|nr:hypothetical protein [Desulfobacteraceae bacterium]
MNIAIIALCCIVTVELVLFTRFFTITKKISSIYHKTKWVITSHGISDHWKEKVLQKYACLNFINTLKLMILLIVVFIPFYVAIALSPYMHLQIETILIAPSGIIGTTLFATIYGMMRKKHYVKK